MSIYLCSTTLEKKNGGATYEISEFQVEGSPERDTRLVDVLLIHGLTGDPIKTWGGSIVADNVVGDCWPRELAVELQSKATFWTLGYPAPLFNSQLGTIYSSSISQEGRAALEELVRAELGKKPIIFVSHSVGGLLAKSILVESARDSSKSQIFDNTHAVVFAGTPHAGSPHAKWRFLVPWVAQMAAKGVGVLLTGAVAAIWTVIWTAAVPFVSVRLFGWTWQVTTPTGLCVALASLLVGAWVASWLAPGPYVLMLDPTNAGLQDLKQDFRRVRSKRTFFTDSFFEKKRLWGLFLIVPWGSADPGVTDCEPKGIRADHISMCKNPHAEPLQSRVKERIKSAYRGKDASVFGNELKLKFQGDTEQTNAYEVLFRKKDGDRGRAEQTFRTFLRKKMRKREFDPKGSELDLALRSDFDEDEWVWNLWCEQTFAEGLRELRAKANKEVKNNYPPPPGSEGAADHTLIPFYRSLRTIERICTGELTDPGEDRKDRELLLGLIMEATKKLDELCKESQGVDADGRTRRLLLRLGGTLQAVQAVQDYVASLESRQGGQELSLFLNNARTGFDNALQNFRNELNPILAPQAAIRRFCESIEGAWWERNTGDKGVAISFFRIEIDAAKNSVVLSDGKSYDKEGLQLTKWKSVIVRIDKVESKIQYLWEGRYMHSNLANVPFHGFAEIEFDKPVKERDAVKGGTGRYWVVNEVHPENTTLEPTKYRRVQEDSSISVMNGGDEKAIQSLIKETLLQW
jgi:hypothetical protein